MNLPAIPPNPSDWLFGRHSILEAMEAGIHLERIYISQEATGNQIQILRKRAKELKIPIDLVPKAAIDRYAGNQTHQGVAARISSIVPLDFYDWLRSVKNEMYVTAVLLDGISDTGNFGAICRTATFFSAAVLISQRHPPLSSSTIKASSGTLFHTTLVKYISQKELVQQLRDHQFWIYSTSEHSTISIYDVEIPNRIVWIIGSEEKGVSPFFQKHSDQLVSIVASGKQKSLNASVATGIFLFATSASRYLSQIDLNE
ncbi:MAG: 23S rRNA (guanosine(2251)-2'-O)-methyltransferase RlmB [bacterium]|nr:23S rRNA (guanosine(2251)-2'-O)-methyltransferase RlmB [bacterium]